MIRKLALAAIPAAFLAMPVLAQEAVVTGEVDISTIDANGDDGIDMLEAQVAWPDLTEADFNAWDTDGDGMLSGAELAVAVEAGLITPLDSMQLPTAPAGVEDEASE